MASKLSTNESRRIHLMDELRGFAVLCMIFYHGFYNMYSMFGWVLGLKLINVFMPAEPFFAGLFIFISGISSRFSRSNLKRGLKLSAVAVLLTVVTVLFLKGNEIYFGILHFLAVCMILFALLQKLLDKIHYAVGIPLFLFLFFVFRNIPSGFIGFEFLNFRMPEILYSTNYLAFLGFPNSEFVSADYFPIIPWVFVFIAGTFAGTWIKKGCLPEFAYKKHIPPLSWLGRHALIIYILHQPVIFCILWLVDYAFSAAR